MARGMAVLGMVVMTASVAALGADELKLLVSVERQTVTAPYPARVTLNLHNSSPQAMWFYRPVGNFGEGGAGAALAPGPEEFGPNLTRGGATLQALLEPADGPPARMASPAHGEVFESAAFPRATLSKLAPQEDMEERATLLLSPAISNAAGTSEAIWGHYKLAVVYRSTYSNAEELDRILGVHLWQGEVKSNTVDLDLEPAPVSAQASVAGSVLDPNLLPIPGVLVSLNDREEARVSQALTDEQGQFSFAHLPYGLYWVTVRRANSTEDTTLFQHIELTPASPAGKLQLVLVTPEIREAKELLHKPVLLMITDQEGKPLGEVNLSITWSSGTVLDEVRGRTADDGTVVVALIPGRNFVTLRRRGCPKEDQRIDVASGGGIDGFKLALECSNK